VSKWLQRQLEAQWHQGDKIYLTGEWTLRVLGVRLGVRLAAPLYYSPDRPRTSRGGQHRSTNHPIRDVGDCRGEFATQ
jgi:hypothetical protein